MKINPKYPDRLLYLLYIIFFISLAFSFRALSSISIGLLIITGFIKNKMETGSWLNANLKNRFLAACFLFYFIQVTGFLLLKNDSSGYNNLQIKSALIFVPMAVCSSNFITRQVRRNLMKIFIWSLLAAILYCILFAIKSYFTSGTSTVVFFYHQLLSPIKHHAVVMSVLLFIVLVYLLEKATIGLYLHNKTVHLLLIVLLAGSILLLSSKLVILLTIICFVYYLMLVLNSKKNSPILFFSTILATLVLILAVLFTQNKVSRRFNEILAGDIKMIQQQHFSQGTYFNGLQFRLLQYRFVKEILIEHDARFTGVSTDAQRLLDKKYLDSDMYKGLDHTTDRGYLGYNTHNEFLESLLFSGIPGLVAFILICLAMLRLATKRRKRENIIISIALLAYALTESVLENQHGIMLFTFFPLFFYLESSNKQKT